MVVAIIALFLSILYAITTKAASEVRCDAAVGVAPRAGKGAVITFGFGGVIAIVTCLVIGSFTIATKITF